MKNFFYAFATLALVTMGLASCSDDEHSDANCSYALLIDSIQYSNEDNAQYDSLIQVSLKTAGLVNTTFEESISIEQTNISYAIDLCDQQAIAKTNETVKNFKSLADTQSLLYSEHQSYLNKKGINKAEDLNLEAFVIHSTLRNISYNFDGYLKIYKIEIK